MTALSAEVLDRFKAYLATEGFLDVTLLETAVGALVLEAKYRGIRFRFKQLGKTAVAMVFFGRIFKYCTEVYTNNSDLNQIEWLQSLVKGTKQSKYWEQVERSFVTDRITLQAQNNCLDQTQQALYEIDAVLQRYGLKFPKVVLVAAVKPAKITKKKNVDTASQPK